MRRALAAGAATLAVLVAGSAHAGLVPPLHSADLSFPVNAAFSAARITADLGHITVTAGKKAAAHPAAKAPDKRAPRKSAKTAVAA